MNSPSDKTADDIIFGAAIANNTRLIAGQNPLSNGNKDQPVNLLFPGLTDFSNVSKSGATYIVKVDEGDRTDFIWKPRECTEDVTSGVCKNDLAYDFPWHRSNIDQVYTFGVSPDGTPVFVYSVDLEGGPSWTTKHQKTYYLTKLGEWTLSIEGLPYRQHVTYSTTNTDQFYYATAEGIVTQPTGVIANGTLYVMMMVTGSVKIAQVDPMDHEDGSFVIDGQSLFTNTAAADGFDAEDGLTSGQSTLREGFVLMAVNLTTGNVTYITPMWGQAGASSARSMPNLGFDNVQVAASDFDGSLYIAGRLRSRLVVGAPVADPFNATANGNKLLLSTFPTTSTELAVVRNAAPPAATAGDDLLILFGFDAKGKLKSSTKTYPSAKVAVSTYFQSAGAWTSLRADDNSTMVYLTGTWGTTTRQDVRLLLTGTEIMATVNAVGLTTPATGDYDNQDAFIAQFDGASLSGGAKWVYPIRGIDDYPSVAEWTVKNKTVFALLSYTNVTFLPKTTSSAASDDTAIYGSTAGRLVSETTGTLYRRSLLSVSGGTRDLVPYSALQVGQKADHVLLNISSDGKLGSETPKLGPIYTGGDIGLTLAASNAQPAAVSIKGLFVAEGRVHVVGLFKGGLSFTSKSGNRTVYAQDGAIHSRDAQTKSIFWATYAADLPPSPEEGKEKDNSLALGLGIGLGVGIPVLIGTIWAIAHFMAKKGAVAAAVKPTTGP